MAINQSSKQYTTTYQGSSAPDKAGFITLMAGASLPSGWLYCDGAAVSRTTYSELFAAIGTAYGVGDNSTTFNLPSLSVVIDGVTRQYIIKPYSDITSAASVGLSTIGGAKVNTHLDYDTIATPANPDSGDYRTYFKSDGKFYKKDSSGTETEIGGGGGGSVGDPTFINYVSNPTFETGATTGWSTYSSTTPPNTVFSASTTLTLSANTTTPLHGTYDLKVAKPASIAQGHGFSYDFAIDPPSKNFKVIVSFDGKTNDLNYVSDHILMYVYNVDTSSYVLSGVSLTKESTARGFSFAFNPGSSTNFKLLFHWTGTNSTAVNLHFDNFRITQGSPVFNITTSSMLTSQTNCFIGTGDLLYAKSTLISGVNYLQLDLASITITAGVSSFSFTLPLNIPPPESPTRTSGLVYDASSTVGTLASILIAASGMVTITKADGGTFTGGSNNSHLRAMLFWII
jgi:hypothetical protein